MVRRWVWIMAIGLVLFGGAWDSATGIAYDLSKLKSVCVDAVKVKPNIEQHLGLSRKAIIDYVYVWLKPKLPKVQIESETGTSSGGCGPWAPTLIVTVALEGGKMDGRNVDYFGFLDIQLIRKTQWETGKVNVGVAYHRIAIIAGPLRRSARYVYELLDQLLTDFAAEYYKAGNP